MEKGWGSYKCILGKGGLMRVWGGACWILGAIFAILGIIGDAMNATLGLEPTSWFLLAIALFVASIPEYIGWAVAVYFDAKEAKSKEKE